MDEVGLSVGDSEVVGADVSVGDCEVVMVGDTVTVAPDVDGGVVAGVEGVGGKVMVGLGPLEDELVGVGFFGVGSGVGGKVMVGLGPLGGELVGVLPGVGFGVVGGDGGVGMTATSSLSPPTLPPATASSLSPPTTGTSSLSPTTVSSSTPSPAITSSLSPPTG